jgi:hypothetical protein
MVWMNFDQIQNSGKNKKMKKIMDVMPMMMNFFEKNLDLLTSI